MITTQCRIRHQINKFFMNQQTFTGFHTDTALQWLGAEIKSLAKYSTQTDDVLARKHHISKHTLYDV